VVVAYQDAIGEDRVGAALLPAGTAGVVIHDGWSAPVARAAASGQASFDDVRIRDGSLRDLGAPDEAQAWGQAS
jgi:alkylation response protein AidB-like acyl-CoA dehydrogenase